ncbi:MAG: hypothetical protein N3A54_06455, partial [Patescibacteria group bacterium]|nr:hypothetical protein [Patescibacteria group bacterium]
MTEAVPQGETTQQQQTQEPPKPNKKPHNPSAIQSILSRLLSRRNPKGEPASPTWTKTVLGTDNEKGSLLGPAKEAFEREAEEFEKQQNKSRSDKRSEFIYKIARRIFRGKPEETIRGVSIEEPKQESTIYTRKINLLLALTRVQHEILRLIGHMEEKRLLHVYKHAQEDYLRLCQSYGIEPSKHIKEWNSEDYRHLPREEQLLKPEEAFFRVLIQPANTLHEHRIEENTQKEELLRLLLSSPELQSNQHLKANEWPEKVRTKVAEEIIHARIAALALYDKFHWREFTRIMMGNHAGRFSTEGGIRLLTNIDANEFQQKATKTLETILLTGVLYRLNREHWKRKNSNTKNQQNQEYMCEVESVPLSVPLGIRRNNRGELEGVFPPKLQTQYNKVQSLEEALKTIESIDSPQPQDVLLQIFDVNEDGPGSQLAFMNNETQIQIRQRIMKTSNPLSITIVRYRNNEVYVSGISDHTTTDGVPLTDHIIGKFMEQMKSWNGETLPLGDFSIDTLLQNSQQAEELEPYTEYTATTTFQGLIELRTFIKGAQEKNIQIVDKNGNTVDTSLFSIGRLISILEGQRHMNLAREQGIARQSTNGTLVNSELIN